MTMTMQVPKDIESVGPCDNVFDARSPNPSRAGEDESAYPPLHARGFFRKGDVIVGNSGAIRTVHSAIEMATRSDAPVCVLGESGTGKELVARSIHVLSSRGDRTMVAVNCASLPVGLVESELFGHAAGAFTGAVRAYDGAFARADGSTLLLDEVGELRLEHQAKLLRVLQFGEVQPLGGRSCKINVRIIAATHRNLVKEVAAGRFREDLFYRIHVLPIVVPPLRRRREDIPTIAYHLLRRHESKAGRPAVGFTKNAVDTLEAHDWPGNVRELDNVILRALLTAEGSRIHRRHLKLDALVSTPLPVLPRRTEIDITKPFRDQKESVVADFESRYAHAMLEATGHNVSESARRAGLDRKSFWSLLKRHGLSGARP